MSQPIKENHWQGLFSDRSSIEVNHYNESGFNIAYHWLRILEKPTPTNEDMEAARLEACRAFVELGGHVILTVHDSQDIPENDRNAPLDMRQGHTQIIGKDHSGWPVVAKKNTGDPGDQYYDWKQETDYNKRLYMVRTELEIEKRKNGNIGHKKKRK